MRERNALTSHKAAQALLDYLPSYDTRIPYIVLAEDRSYKFIICQNSRVGYWLIVATRDSAESGFDSGERLRDVCRVSLHRGSDRYYKSQNT